ncbi:hypothetical protein F3Y22_tig00112071pilonHSYRG00009 [Hibiscus syriacus]|uniref:Uncharacterized protein n=1 Tax=Hibiscus syriacus TaxID=106335 RepID=A0A6A2YCM3_HIBSY|nr:hypothetical protein F3Y22_tig00112071pilonHSYRG00009 [Hibiscus syriacus]
MQLVADSVVLRLGFPTSLLSDREQGGLSRAAAAAVHLVRPVPSRPVPSLGSGRVVVVVVVVVVSTIAMRTWTIAMRTSTIAMRTWTIAMRILNRNTIVEVRIAIVDYRIAIYILHCDSPSSHCDSRSSQCDSLSSHCDSRSSRCDSQTLGSGLADEAEEGNIRLYAWSSAGVWEDHLRGLGGGHRGYCAHERLQLAAIKILSVRVLLTLGLLDCCILFLGLVGFVLLG